MSYLYIKAACLLCDRVIEGAEERMNGGKCFRYEGGKVIWEEAVLESSWGFYSDEVQTENGYHRGARFYLCPEHQGLDDWIKGFKWLKKHITREEVINVDSVT